MKRGENERLGTGQAAGRSGEPGLSKSGMYLVIGMILVAGGLFLGLRFTQGLWNARYRANKELGDRLVIEASATLQEKRPPAVNPEDWDDLIAATREMLQEVVGSGLLDQAGLERLGAELRERSARVEPGDAPLEVSRLWRDMEQRAGPALTRITIPRPIELAVILNPLDRAVPVDVDPARWNAWCDQTRRALLAYHFAPCWDRVKRNAWMKQWAERLLRATPRDARSVLESFLRELIELDPELAQREGVPALLTQVTARN